MLSSIITVDKLKADLLSLLIVSLFSGRESAMTFNSSNTS